ncbi:TRAP transporter small permease [Bordetella genomosp. 12]|uniref:TRAP transporter small permease protein n=1 Tax=Bordetella genomosp. 12 TaxID=463035 RepID=A0A261VBQ6_9BORD|nr:TRAP transporter small permease [Bordetella genomosp. 12]OZI71586.1 C4-dicarboxylate ABC transporter permease [Bordetella genomosp. 12]
MNQPLPPSGEAPHAARPFHIEEAIAALIMALLCLITFANVLTRYFTDVSFAFTEEFSVFLVVVMTFVGAATAFTRGHHLAITFLVDKLPARGRRWQRRFALLCALIMFGVLLWYGGLMCWDDYETEVTSPGLGVPQWWYTISIPVLSALVIVRLLQLLLRRSA